MVTSVEPLANKVFAPSFLAAGTYAVAGVALPGDNPFSAPDLPVKRNCDGVWPVHRLKAKVKALTSWKPRSQATCDTERVASRR